MRRRCAGRDSNAGPSAPEDGPADARQRQPTWLEGVGAAWRWWATPPSQPKVLPLWFACCLSPSRLLAPPLARRAAQRAPPPRAVRTLGDAPRDNRTRVLTARGGGAHPQLGRAA